MPGTGTGIGTGTGRPSRTEFGSLRSSAPNKTINVAFNMNVVLVFASIAFHQIIKAS